VKKKVLVVEPVVAAAFRTAEEIVASGGDAVVVTSAAAARCVSGTFDLGLFSFDLPDGNGIVLAAEMLLDSRVYDVGFFCHDYAVEPCDEGPRGVCSTTGDLEEEAFLAREAG
jgi:hypothetical protein